MAAKQFQFHADARQSILRGASVLADAVRVTLGPKSKCVLIEKKFGRPLVCDDGVTIAKEVELKDPEENLGAQMVREAAERTGDVVGDGTTTSTLLAHALLMEGVRNVAAGASAIDLRRGLMRGLKSAVETLKTLSRPVTTRREKAQVAAISAHNNATVGEMVAEAVEKVGAEGAITVEDSKSTETVLDVVEGMQFDRGYISPYFVTDPEAMEAALDEPLILLHEKKISNVKDLLPLLEEVVRIGKPLLIVSEDVEAEALATLVLNRIRGALPCAAVKAPGFGDRRKAMLQDIAILTGGQLIAEEIGIELKNVSIDQLGKAKRVVMDKDTTTIVGGAGAKDAIDGRCRELRRQIEDTTSDYDKEKLRERLAKLTGGVAVIRVGAPSEAEAKRLRESFEDAISATRAAIAEGVLPGAGLALLRAIDAVDAEAAKAPEDEKTGLRILKRALEAPTRQIAENSSLDGGVVIDRMRSGSGNIGLDASSGQFVDLVEAGIIDATKVVRVALENAVSVASTLLLTEATLTEEREKKAERPAPAPEFAD
ncbi:MAG TPA: chaperonin GroEL [Bryobacteraceae bacterium]|nr:chaperonin GroEL [Bryobacteraceae bacterium]